MPLIPEALNLQRDVSTPHHLALWLDNLQNSICKTTSLNKPLIQHTERAVRDDQKSRPIKHALTEDQGAYIRPKASSYIPNDTKGSSE